MRSRAQLEHRHRRRRKKQGSEAIAALRVGSAAEGVATVSQVARPLNRTSLRSGRSSRERSNKATSGAVNHSLSRVRPRFAIARDVEARGEGSRLSCQHNVQSRQQAARLTNSRGAPYGRSKTIRTSNRSPTPARLKAPSKRLPLALAGGGDSARPGIWALNRTGPTGTPLMRNEPSWRIST